MGEFEGKVVLVTGAGSGIGRATALVFAREGARTACSDIDPASGEETVRMIEDLGGTASFIAADVSVGSDVEAMVPPQRTVMSRCRWPAITRSTEG